MRIYISGPITGKTWADIAATFVEAHQKLEEAGHNVIDPSEIMHWGLTWESYMRIAITILENKEVDAVLMLKGWRESKGAVIERQWAVTHGIPIVYQDPRDRRAV